MNKKHILIFLLVVFFFNLSFVDAEDTGIIDSGSEVPRGTFEENVPDSNFRKCITDLAAKGHDTRSSAFNGEDWNVNFTNDGSSITNFTTDDFGRIVALYCDNYDIKDVKGVEYFPNLKILSLTDNPISSLNLNNPELSWLFIAGTKVKYSNLKMTDSMVNKITTLDVGNLGLSTNDFNNILDKYKKLDSLAVGGNPNISGSVDTSVLPDLKSLWIDDTSISNINGVDKLEILSAYRTKITSLDLSNNSVLKYLNIGGDSVGSLDLSKAKNLKNLYINNSKLNSLSINSSANLEKVDLSGNPNLGNQIQGWVNQSTNLVDFMSDYNKLSSLDLSGLTKLRTLSLFSNSLTSLKLPNTNTLLSLNVSVNNISSLDLSPYTNLEKLYVSSLNNLKSLDLSHNTKLKDFVGGLSGFSNSIDFSKNTLLEYIAVNSDYAKNINFNIFSNLKQVFSVYYKKVPVYGSSYSVSSLLKEIPSNIKSSSSYQFFDSEDASKSISNTATLSPDSDNFAHIKVHSDNIVNSDVNKSGIAQQLFDGYYDILFVKLTSDKYVIDEDKNTIDVGGDNDDTILKNLKLTFPDVLANISGNKLVIKYNNQQIKEFTLQRVSNPKTGSMFVFGVMFILVVSICTLLVVRQSTSSNKI